MKNQTLKTLFILTFVAGIFSSAYAQTSTGLHAFFKGTETDVKAAIQSNTLVFFVSGLENDQQVADFVKKSTPYAKGFTMTVSGTDTQKRECKIKLTTSADMKFLQRFFMSVGISDVELNAKTSTVADFFKPFIQ